MAQLTSLNAFGLSGGVHAFSAKTPDAGGSPHNPGRITELGVGAWSGQRHAFLPKTPDSGGGVHPVGRLTTLRPYGVSGSAYIFVAKERETTAFPKTTRRQQLHGWNRYRLLQWGGRFKP